MGHASENAGIFNGVSVRIGPVSRSVGRGFRSYVLMRLPGLLLHDRNRALDVAVVRDKRNKDLRLEHVSALLRAAAFTGGAGFRDRVHPGSRFRHIQTRE